MGLSIRQNVILGLPMHLHLPSSVCVGGAWSGHRGRSWIDEWIHTDLYIHILRKEADSCKKTGIPIGRYANLLPCEAGNISKLTQLSEMGI